MQQNTTKPGKRFMTPEGNMCVNFHNIFFIMTRLGNYLPWKPTVHHGKLMPQQEWKRLRDLNGGPEKVKELTPFLNKRAEKIAAELQKSPFYKMTAEQVEFAKENLRVWHCAKLENISVEEYIRRKQIRDERAQKRSAAAKENGLNKKETIPVKVENGKTSFFLGSIPALQKLSQKFA